MRIRQDARAVGDQRLDASPLGHGPFAAREEPADVAEDGGVFAQPFPKQLGDQIAGEVVGSRAEAAGGEDELGAGEGFADGLGDVAAGVGHGDLPGDDPAQVGQLAAEPLRVRIEHPAQHQFGAGVDEFYDHRLKAKG